MFFPYTSLMQNHLRLVQVKQFFHANSENPPINLPTHPFKGIKLYTKWLKQIHSRVPASLRETPTLSLRQIPSLRLNHPAMK